MNPQEIKNKIDSISYYQNRHIKNNALNLCDEIIKSKLLTKYGKSVVEKIKNEITKIEDPWSRNSQSNFTDLCDIQKKINELYSIFE
ncbi:hypothetical protein [Flavobacterium sp. UBA4854]|uniref:hypothetical protein n=1 Tax=Flavobacterium sp. UBA4854 TaxID=1946548 RepID=UPI00257DF9D8|nr:hypothetical protein [Flavobacterium sp. UBA4854]